MRYATGQVASGEWEDNRLAVPAEGAAVPEGAETPDGAVPQEPAVAE